MLAWLLLPAVFAEADSKPRSFHAMLSAYAGSLIYFFPACHLPPTRTAYDDFRDLRELRQPVRHLRAKCMRNAELAIFHACLLALHLSDVVLDTQLR